MAIVRTGYANFAAFPPVGAVDIIYVDLSNGNEYTWVTSAYVAYTPTLVGVSLGDKSAAWFTANPTLLLAKGQIVFLDDQSGQYKKGDGVTALSALSFLGAGGGSGVQSVNGNGVDNTDPLNPNVNILLADIATNNGGFLDDAPIADMINNLPTDTLTGSSLFMYRKNATGVLAKESFITLASFLETAYFDSRYQATLGYTAENQSNKENTTLDTSTTKYPTNNLVKTNVDTKLPIAATQTTGVSLTFLTDSIYGTIGTPETGNITYSSTNAKIGVTNLIIHNNGTAPTFAANMKETTVSKGYSLSVINYISVTYINSTEVIYTIFQRS